MTASVSGLPAPKELDTVEPSNVTLLPRGLVTGDLATTLIENGQAFRLCGKALGFSTIETVIRSAGYFKRYACSVTAFDPWRRVLNTRLKDHVAARLDKLAAPRAPFGGLTMDCTRVMGIINVTPDSFSDGGDHATPDAALSHGVRLAEQGANILDVGGESTRPGADPVSPEEEQRRVLPVVRGLAEKGLTVSIDTRHASTMDLAIDSGAAIVNDVTALTGDSEAINIVAKRKAPVILMHMLGQPKTMQSDPTYTWAPMDIFESLAERVQACVDAGVDEANLCIDPGIGFGKTDRHNLDLLNGLTLLHGMGCPVMVGASRKSFIGRLSQEKDPKQRLSGSLAVAVAAADQGVQILRVHDVAETRQALLIAPSINSPGLEP